jgi:hypothetical protein
LGTLQLVATVCCGLFAGAALYITLVEHPVRLQADLHAALAQWEPSYRRATLLQVPLAGVGGGVALVTWYLGAGRAWLVGGLLLLAVVPFTLLAIMPTNHALHGAVRGERADGLGLLVRWGRLHAVRTAFSVLAFLTMVSALIGDT